MARPDCPRCASDLVVAVPSGAPSEHIIELRGGRVPAVALEGPTHWLCRSCGHRWEPDARGPAGGSPAAEVAEPTPEPDVAESGPPVPPLDPSALLGLEGGSVSPDEWVSSGETGTTLGAVLRRAREQAGRSLAEAAKQTSIWERHLLALENDAPLEEFPAPSYARFFLREYAEFLGLDPAPLLREFDARHTAVEEPPLEPLPDPGARRKVATRILAGLSAAALLFIAFEQPGSDPGAGPSLRTGSPPVRVHDSAHVPLADAATRTPSGVRVVLRPIQPCWVEVVSDGEIVASLTLQPGDPVAYRAREELRLRLGNAGGVRLRVNGERVETGGPGEVVSFTFRRDEGRVLIERG